MLHSWKGLHQSTGLVSKLRQVCLDVLSQTYDIEFCCEDAGMFFFGLLFHEGRISTGVAAQYNSGPPLQCVLNLPEGPLQPAKGDDSPF